MEGLLDRSGVVRDAVAAGEKRGTLHIHDADVGREDDVLRPEPREWEEHGQKDPQATSNHRGTVTADFDKREE